MRAGLFLAYWPWFSLEEQLELSVLADELGLDSVWISEAWGQDAVSVLGLLAGRTERVALGSGLMQIPARQPTATAMAACTLDVLSGGRFRLGLGVSGPQVSEGWYGVPFTRPLRRTREYVEIVRAALAREGGLSYEGEEWTLPHTGGMGLGKPLKLLVRPWIAWYLGAMGAPQKNFYVEVAERYGHGESARACQQAFLAGDRAGAAAALTDELLDATALATTPEGLEGRLAEYERAGVTTFVAVPCGDRAAVARAVAAAVGTGRAASPDPTPNSDRLASPGSDRAASPGSDRAASPGSDRPASPDADRAASPHADRPEAGAGV